jgi:4'-phosphopantetheinyl transferase
LINDYTENSDNSASMDFERLQDRDLTLRADEVHVWHAHLEEHDPDSLKLLLTEDEIARADRFHFAKDRNHFVVARGLLRKLLGRYVGVSAADLRFAYADKGKPALAKPQGSLLHFNLAHSHGRAIYAFSIGRELGVDLELKRKGFTGDQIAERFFSPAEVALLATVPVKLKQQAFFDCWTRKEAYIKARGDGLSMPLDEFDVSFAPGAEAALLGNHKEPTEVARWTMRAIPAPDGYAAALVVSGRDFRVRVLEVEKS